MRSTNTLGAKAQTYYKFRCILMLFTAILNVLYMYLYRCATVLKYLAEI